MLRIVIAIVVLLSLVGSSALVMAAKKPAAGKKDAAAAAPADPAAPPKDAQWTIYCQAIAGPDHVSRANAVKNELLRATGLKDWYVIHNEGESVIYFGFYRSINDPKDKKETTRAQEARKQIDALADANGSKVFRHCFFVEITSPDPSAPPEWDLRNAKGFWSLEIAGYKDHPQRKQAAVDAVREARKSGIEAYYFHGPSTSSVCIGAWPREAVLEQDEGDAQAAPENPNQDVLVLPAPIAGMGKLEVRNKEGHRVRALAPRTEYADPTLIAAIAQYPSYAVNAQEMIERVKDPATGQMVDVPRPSLLVKIPQDTTPSLLRAGANTPSAAPAPTLVAPTTPSQAPGAGTLKSIGQ